MRSMLEEYGAIILACMGGIGAFQLLTYSIQHYHKFAALIFQGLTYH